MNVLFFGSPEYSLATLNKLIASHHKVVGVFTQPDRKSGRGNKTISTPVNLIAQKHHIPVYTLESLKTEEAFNLIKSISFDMGLVIAYGNILPQKVLDIPKYGFINAHGSLLPLYRGASPITAPILNADKETGVTIQQMVLKVDAGNIILQKAIPIERTDNAQTLHDKLSELSAELSIQVCDSIENGTAIFTPQNESLATHVKKLSKDMGRINWNESAETIENKIKAFFPWPGCYTYIKISGKLSRVKIIKGFAQKENGEPGVVIDNNPLHFTIGTGNGTLRIIEMQKEGKVCQDTATFLNGYPISKGQKMETVDEK